MPSAQASHLTLPQVPGGSHQLAQGQIQRQLQGTGRTPDWGTEPCGAGAGPTLPVAGRAVWACAVGRKLLPIVEGPHENPAQYMHLCFAKGTVVLIAVRPVPAVSW